MEKNARTYSSFRQGWKVSIGQKEKKCNKCGFVTFSLHVLYKHRHKCRGQLLGHPFSCPHCRRKFHYISLYRTHKVLCLTKIKKRKLFRKQLKEKYFGLKAEKPHSPAKEYSCPICQTSFSTKEKFTVHLRKPSCESNLKIKKPAHSARKSFNGHKDVSARPNFREKQFTNMSWFEHNSLSGDELYHCLWCKSYYPTKSLLHKHLAANYKCSRVYYKAKSSGFNKHSSFTARKSFSPVQKSSMQKSFSPVQKSSMQRAFSPVQKSSTPMRKPFSPLVKSSRVVAKKTFSNKRHQREPYKEKKPSRSARKSFPSSEKKQFNHRKPDVDTSSPSTLFSCPSCHEDFSDMYVFFQHQKKFNHWGKATKSLPSTNAPVQNNTVVSKEKIKEFLRSHTCSFCSQTFATELEKQQHIRIHHPSLSSTIEIVPVPVTTNKVNIPTRSYKPINESSDSDYEPDKEKVSSVSKSVKKKLKQQPNTCPDCSKTFSNSNLRNIHFNEVHLKIHQCQLCSSKFQSASNLNYHFTNVHKKFECQECKTICKNEMLLIQHVLKSHSDKDPKSCLPERFKESSLKNKPKEKSIEISGSNENTNDSSNHSNPDYYYCEVCGIGYLKLCGLQSHRKSKYHKHMLQKKRVQKSTSGPPPSPPSNSQEVKQPDTLTCSECSDDFTAIKDFVPHRLSHFSVQSKYLKITDLNPYMCEICSEVLDSHSKVQLHLFWHLQVESTSSNSTSHFSSNKKNTVTPENSGVAKKSFSKQSSESLQEVTISGVSKILFTCEACNIGFTTKEHYTMHINKLCKKVKKTNAPSVILDESNLNRRASFEGVEFSHCINCNFLFSSSAKFEQHKPHCFKAAFDSKSKEYVNNLYAVKSALSRELADSGCVTCGALLDVSTVISAHLETHGDENSINDEEVGDLLHCAFCNCLFPLQTFKLHKQFCKVSYDLGDKKCNSKYMDILKSALELNCAAAGCLSCGQPIDDLDMLVKHLTLHQEKQIQNENKESNICNGERTQTNEMDISDSPAKTGDVKSAKNLNKNTQEDSVFKKYFDSPVDSDTKTKNFKTVSDNDKPSSHKKLQEDFSKLLCLLISDPELMQTLGFGKLPVDEVLINVLEQMGQASCTIAKLTPLEKFRKNIRTLLEICLKDQIMEAIGSAKTIDEIVVEALKILDSEENMDETETPTA